MIILALKIFLCLLIAALLGMIIGYLIGKGCKKIKDIPKEEDNFKKDDYLSILERTKIAKKALEEGKSPTKEALSTSISIMREHDHNRLKENKESKYEMELKKELDLIDSFKPKTLDLDNVKDNQKDDLTKIKGIGKKIEAILNELGIFNYEQIASWNEENILWIEHKIGFPGRVKREKWIDQAKELIKNKNISF